MLLLLLITAVLAESFVGERLQWEVQFAGVTGAHLWSTVLDGDGETVLIEAGARSADWYTRLYPVDDFARSTWTPGQGSSRYETRFREGRFHQDQDMRLGADEITVLRRQRFDEGWREWSTPYPAAPGAEDPLSMIYALRRLTGEGPWRYPVFSGDKSWPLEVEVLRRDHLTDTVVGDVDVLVLSLRTLHEGDWEQRGRFVVYVTDDERRIPVRLQIKSSIGSMKVVLVEYQPPQ